MCYNLCKIASLQYIIVNENNSGLENYTSISRKSNTNREMHETDAWEHLKWANLLGAVGRHVLKVSVSSKMHWPAQARCHMSHTRCSSRSRMALPPACCNCNNLPGKISNGEPKLISWGTKLTQGRLQIDGGMAMCCYTILYNADYLFWVSFMCKITILGFCDCEKILDAVPESSLSLFNKW